MNSEPRKILIIGEVGSGKTWLWNSYFQKRVPKEYSQTIFDNHTTSMIHRGREVQITLFDTCGSDDYFELRKLLYPGTHVVIFCVPIENPSLMKGKHTRIDHWVSEFKHYCSGIPILVVGTKKDVRDDVDALLQLAEQKLKPVKASELASVCKKLKAIGFLECSAKSGDGIEQVFLTALKLSLTM